jgi:pilus assembly protein Flp/PilA
MREESLRTGIARTTEGVMTVAIQRWLRREEGQGLVEYALIILLVSVALVGALVTFSGAMNGLYSQAVSALG